MMVVAADLPSFVLLATLLALLSSPGLTENIDYDYPDVRPTFITKPEAFNVKEGDAISLPCDVKDVGPYPIVWKRGRRIISVGSTLTAVDRRYRVSTHASDGSVNTSAGSGKNRLRLSNVKPRDAGQLTCSLSTDPVMELTHTVNVLYGPKISTVPESGVLQAKSGQSVAMQCLAHGKPTPKVYWKKKASSAGSSSADVHQDGADIADSSMTSATYRLSRVVRGMSGLYECHAENGVGAAAVATVQLQVHYAPDIEVEKSTVFSGEGRSATLACYIHSDPPAQVTWSREGESMDGERHVASDDHANPRPSGSRHVLHIKAMRREDFDTYTCHATNSLGTARARMVLTGVAERVQVTSQPMGGTPDTYDLSWQVSSFGHIIEYKVAYRRAKFNSSTDQPSPWKEVIVPNAGSDENLDATGGALSRHLQQITLRNLRPSTLYHLYVQARNKHGWNAVSDMFHFSTMTRGAALESRVASASDGGFRTTRPLLLALCIIVFLVVPAML